MTDAPRLRCPCCWNHRFLDYDGNYWTTCRACGARSTPARMRKAAERPDRLKDKAR